MASSKGFRSAPDAPALPGRRAAHDAEAPRTATAISRRSAIVAAVAGIGGAAALTGCSPASPAPSDRPSDATTSSTFAFDTFCTFTVYGDDEAPAKLSAACARYDKLFDLYDPASDIARVNDARGAATAVDRETAELVAEALAFCASARGLFDITVGAVSTLWDFEKGIRPADDSIANALQHVDWKLVDVDVEASTVRLADPAAKIDLGGIAKGFIADRLCKLLENETTATGAALSLGGNIAYFGSKPDGTPWNTGIRDLVGSITRPVRELKGFEKIFLRAGESKTVSFKITPELLRFYDYDLNHVAEPGDFDLFIGGSSQAVRTARITLK